MKKTIIASVVALVIAASGMANAAPADKNAGTFDLNFAGTVSAVTCALEPTVDGVQGKNDIQLGQTEPTQKGQDISVVFKPTAAAAATCANATNNGFVMQWSGVGGKFDSNGLKAASGAADDAYVQITAVNAQNNVMANAENFQFIFDNSKVTGDGLQYKVNLLGGTKVGDMTATAQVKHWYK